MGRDLSSVVYHRRGGVMADKAERARLDEIQQMLAAPSDAYSAGEWCDAANALAAELAAAEKAREDFTNANLSIHKFSRQNLERAEAAARERDMWEEKHGYQQGRADGLEALLAELRELAEEFRGRGIYLKGENLLDRVDAALAASGPEETP